MADMKQQQGQTSQQQGPAATSTGAGPSTSDRQLQVRQLRQHREERAKRARAYNTEHSGESAEFQRLTGIDPMNVSAVREWQSRHGLKADGMIGMATVQAASDPNGVLVASAGPLSLPGTGTKPAAESATPPAPAMANATPAGGMATSNVGASASSAVATPTNPSPAPATSVTSTSASASSQAAHASGSGVAESAHAAAAAGSEAISPYAPLPEAGEAFHDGGNGHALGEDDEVFRQDKEGNLKVIPVFAATAEGVVAAAFYELHRGDKRSMAEIMADHTAERVKHEGGAGHEGKAWVTHERKDHTKYKAHEGTNDDAAGSQKVSNLDSRVGKKVLHSGAMGPIEAYVASVQRGVGIPWCGSFATFCYLRAGIGVESLAYSLNVPDVLAASEGRGGKHGEYYRTSGDEGSATNFAGRKKAYTGELQEGESGKSQHYHKANVSSLDHLDIREGDVFWNEHSPSSGHVGVIVGVHRTPKEVTLVTIEGNASDAVASKVHKISLGANGKIESTLKGWGRPAQLGGAAPAEPAAEPEWMGNAEKSYFGKHDSGHDR